VPHRVRNAWTRPKRRLLLAAAVIAIGRGWGCVDCGAGVCGPTSDECQAYLQTADWHVDLRGAEISEGDSRRGSVAPGLRLGCNDTVRSVDWTVDSAAASLTPVGRRNAGQDTAGDIARAWVTGVGIGEATVGARINFTDGSAKDARPAAVRVMALESPSGRSVILAEGTVGVTFNQFTEYGSAGPVAFTVPGAGRLDVVVDWPDFSATFNFFVYEGPCSTLPCLGPRLYDGSILQHVKPRRESFPVAAGDSAMAMWGVGAGTAALRYEVRFTPD